MKPVYTTPRYFKLLNGPFGVLQLNYIQLPLPNEYKYVFIIVSVFTQSKLNPSFEIKLLPLSFQKILSLLRNSSLT